jgi:hypothetical protein
MLVPCKSTLQQKWKFVFKLQRFGSGGGFPSRRAMKIPWGHLLVLALVADQVAAMFSKRPLPDRESRPREERLRANLEDLFLAGDVSGVRAHTLFEDGSWLHPQFDRLARAGRGGRKKVARNLRTLLGRNSKWPQPYLAKIPVWHRKTQKTTVATVPIMLPHELLHSLLKINELQDLSSTARLASTVMAHLQKCRDEMMDQSVVAVGLWGDGVPCNWDRSESLEAGLSDCFVGKNMLYYFR